MYIRWNKMENKTDSYENFDDSTENFDVPDPVFEGEGEILLIDENPGHQKTENCDKKKNIATWRKIEEFWENYELNKQINDDIYN